jgi:hypothetical protein
MATEPVNDPSVNPELARRNMRFGWILFAVFALLFAGTVGVAFVYLAIA